MQEVEAAIAEQNRSACVTMLSLLDLEMRALLVAINAYEAGWEKEAASSAVPINLDQVASIMTELYGLIVRDDPRSLKKMQELRQTLDGTLFVNEIELLDSQLKAFDFETAKGALQSLAARLNISLGE